MKLIKTAILLFIFSVNSNADGIHPAQAIVKNTTDEVLATLQQQNSSQQINSLINDIIVPHFDFIKMSQLILGSEWKKLDDSKRELFVTNFQQLLINTYSTALTEFENESIDILDAKTGKNPNIAAVPTRINLVNDKPMIISYMMMKGDESWKVVDMSISGISIIKNYRATYASEIRNGGFDALMQKLIKKNELAHL